MVLITVNVIDAALVVDTGWNSRRAITASKAAINDKRKEPGATAGDLGKGGVIFSFRFMACPFWFAMHMFAKNGSVSPYS